jgi:uncharacterized protein YndB with AHSA1/START domain
MRQVNASTRIDATPVAVFDFLADLDNLPRWQAGIVAAELTTPGPVGKGSRARVLRELMGRQLLMDFELIDHQPGRRLELASEASGIRVVAALDLVPEDSGTQLTFAMWFQAQNPLLGPLEAMVAGAAEQEVADSLERIRQLVGKPPAS